jgi:SNF2 family DNA or RNA helicase
MAEVDYKDDHFLVSLPFHENHRIEDIPDKKWQPVAKRWLIPANWRSAEILSDNIHAKYFTDAACKAVDQSINSKPLSKEELTNLDYPFKTAPMGHQLEAYRKAYNQDQFALFFEQGLGKTKTSIDIVSMWYMDGLIDSVIVVCPVSIRQVWEREFETHCFVDHGLRLMNTQGAIQWGKDALKVLVVGVESLSQGKTFDMTKTILHSLGPLAMIVVESSRVKNHKAIRTERTIELSSGCAKRLILTGTPVTQGIQDLYSQFQVLNPETLALKSFYAFRNRYCVEEQVRGAPHGVKKVVGYRNVDELLSLIEPWSLRKEKQDCLDLPEKTFQVRTVSLTPEQRKVYASMKKNMVAKIEKEGGDHILQAKMILEVYLRLQQIAGGFYPELNDEGKVIAVHPIPGGNPKLAELISFMDEIPRPVVIMCRFRTELEAITGELSKSRRVVQFHGGLDEHEKKESVSSFMDGRADVFIATLQSASYGLTLTKGSMMVYYSMGFSLEEFLQSQDRIHRIGQTLPCTYVSIAAANSVDQEVVEALLSKKSVADFVNDRIKGGADINSLI